MRVLLNGVESTRLIKSKTHEPPIFVPHPTPKGFSEQAHNLVETSLQFGALLEGSKIKTPPVSSSSQTDQEETTGHKSGCGHSIVMPFPGANASPHSG